MENGYAHVIENSPKYNIFFHHEIICSILDLDKFEVMKP